MNSPRLQNPRWLIPWPASLEWLNHKGYSQSKEKASCHIPSKTLFQGISKAQKLPNLTFQIYSLFLFNSVRKAPYLTKKRPLLHRAQAESTASQLVGHEVTTEDRNRSKKMHRKEEEERKQIKGKEKVTIHFTKCWNKSFRLLSWTGGQRRGRCFLRSWSESAPAWIRCLQKKPHRQSYIISACFSGDILKKWVRGREGTEDSPGSAVCA